MQGVLIAAVIHIVLLANVVFILKYDKIMLLCLCENKPLTSDIISMKTVLN